MGSAALTLVKHNPATNIRRLVFISRELSPDEARQLNEAFDGKVGSQIQTEPWTNNFTHQEQALVEAIEEEQKRNPGLTGFCLTSDHLNHATAVVTTAVCANLNLPLVLLQHEGGGLNTIEVIYDKKRFVKTTAEPEQAIGARG